MSPESVRVLVIYSHPVETSVNAALHDEVIERLRQAGREVDECDLCAEDFNPVMSRGERLGYHLIPQNQQPVQRYVDRVMWAEAIVFCFPTRCFGLPAMLKGFFDRVFMPGVAFDMSDPAHVKSALTHLRFVAAVTTYGRSRWTAFLMGDLPRKAMTRYMHALTGGRAKVSFLANYHMNVATRELLDPFKSRVGDAMARLG